MTSGLKTWFVSANQERISNDDVVASALAIERQFNSNYNFQLQLSSSNISKIRWANSIQADYNKLCGTSGPVLSDAQLNNTENLVAGDAGERMVDQLVRKVVNSSNAVFRNVVLPYEYGEQNSHYDNQIDNLVVTNTGIYCIEVKVRSLYRGAFNFKKLAPDIYNQISYHKKAVQTALESAGFKVQPNLIKNVIVIVARGNEQSFPINNQENLTAYGACVVDLDHLNMLIGNGFNHYSLAPKQIEWIEQIIYRSLVTSKRTYPNNVRFCLTQQDLDKLVQMEQTVQWHVPLEHNITYSKALNDLSMRGLNGNQQNFFWLLVGRLFGRGQPQISMTIKDLKKATNYRSRNRAYLDKAMQDFVKNLQKMPFVQQASYDSDRLTVTVDNQYLPLFNQYSSEFMSWNNQIFKNIRYSHAETLFRKFVQLANVGSYQVTLSELRDLLGLPVCYKNHFVIAKINKAILYLAPFFPGLSYKLKKGQNNKILEIVITFARFNPQELLAVAGADQYLHNISTNTFLSEPDKQQAQALFEKNFLA